MSEALFDKVIISGPDGELAEVVGGALQTTGGGGGGGGAVTVADGADVTQGALADAVVAAGAAGSVSAKLRRLTTDLGAQNTLLGGGLPAALGVGGSLKVGGNVASDSAFTEFPLPGGGRASTATPSAVSADGDAVAAWLTRTGAHVVAGRASTSPSPVSSGESAAIWTDLQGAVILGGGTVASGATDSGNPVKVGGKYSNAAPTFADGNRGDLLIGQGGGVVINAGAAAAAADGVTASAASIANHNSAATARVLASGGYSYSDAASQWDRNRGNNPATLLSSSARTATTSSADQTNYNGRGVLIVVNVTAESGTTTLTLTVEGKDSISSNYYSLITGVVVYNAGTDTPTTTRGVLIYPGVLNADAIGAGATNLIAAKSLALPRTWRATITPSDASSQTYSVSGVTIV